MNQLKPLGMKAGRELPISFTAPMVRAIIREIEHPGTGKTQTRRVLKRPKWAAPLVDAEQDENGVWHIVDEKTGCLARLPIPAPGDRLYVREAWRTTAIFDAMPPRNMGDEFPIRYEADMAWGNHGITDKNAGRYRQGMHMPKWASRIWLTVEDVRIERVQDISDDDCLAEGVKPEINRISVLNRLGVDAEEKRDLERLTLRPVFRDLWDSINAKRGFGWDQNPVVYAVTFKPEWSA